MVLKPKENFSGAEPHGTDNRNWRLAILLGFWVLVEKPKKLFQEVFWSFTLPEK
jgi:hypothetical protein